MNRNNEARFSKIPKMSTSRSRFKRKQNVKFTMNAGELIPFYVDEVLPGDTFSVDTAGICRMTTPIYPVMDNCYLDIYYFYVPMRIVWENTKEFFGENNVKAWTVTTERKIPCIRIQPTTGTMLPKESSILDYMGIPTKFVGNGKTKDINALPIRGYVKIWNEWFRDQNIDNPAILTVNDETTTYVDDDVSTREKTLQQAQTGGRPLWVNKFHDYFTSALPSPQKGEATLIPLSGNAPVYMYKNYSLNNTSIYTDTIWLNGTESGAAFVSTDNINNRQRPMRVSGSANNGGTTSSDSAYLGANLNEVSAATINNLRQAFAVQQFMEADARGGTRYREIIASHFGVYIDDKTVQIPEYLGGQRYMINVSQVVQTSSTSSASPQGNAAAISVTPFKENSFTKSFQEHGYVIGVCCIRNDNTYQQGIERMWSRTNKYDFYWPEFAHLGEQAVLNKEIYAQANSDDEKAFGYQEAYAEYRYKPNRVAGKFRSNSTNTLDAWHYADKYVNKPTLSQDWLATDKSVISRTLAVQNQPQFICDFLIENDSVRPMPVYGTPGLTKL